MPYIFTDEEFKQVQQMVNGIASRYLGWSTIDQEELKNEFWCTIMSINEKKDTFEPNLLATACYRVAVNLHDKGVRKRNNEIAGEDLPITPIDDKGIGDKEDIAIADSLIDNMLSYFPKGSKEYRFVFFQSYYSGALGHIDPPEGVRKFNTIVAKECGYSSSSSSGYASIRDEVRDYIKFKMGSSSIVHSDDNSM